MLSSIDFEPGFQLYRKSAKADPELAASPTSDTAVYPDKNGDPGAAHQIPRDEIPQNERLRSGSFLFCPEGSGLKHLFPMYVAVKKKKKPLRIRFENGSRCARQSGLWEL